MHACYYIGSYVNAIILGYVNLYIPKYMNAIALEHVWMHLKRKLHEYLNMCEFCYTGALVYTNILCKYKLKYVHVIRFGSVWMLSYWKVCECYWKVCECYHIWKCVNVIILENVWIVSYWNMCECCYIGKCVEAITLECVRIAVILQSVWILSYWKVW